MSAELTLMLQKQAEAFEAFKKANDERLAQVEKKGAADGVLVAQVEKLNEILGEQQKTISELNAKAGRRGASEGEELAEQHGKAFRDFLRKGRTDGLDALRTKASQVDIGTNGDGGYAIPENLEKQVIALEQKLSPMRQLCNVVTVSSEIWEQLVDTGGVTSGWVAETASRAATNTPTLQSVTGIFGEIYANPAATQRSLEDLMFDVEAWLADRVANEFAQQENAAFLTGNGTNKPKGILAYTLSTSIDGSRTFGQVQKIHSGTDGSIGVDAATKQDKLVDLIHAMKPGYRQGAAFMMSNLTLASYRKVKDDTGNYIWQPGMPSANQIGTPAGQLFGYPVYQNDDMASDGTSAANAVVFANLKQAYNILDRRGMLTLRDPFTAKPLVNFYTTKRVGGVLVNDYCVKVLVLSV
jgi:HK97 family phage major capsid protein